MTDFQARRYLDDLADSIKRRCRDPKADSRTIAASARQALDLAERETDHRPGLMVAAAARQAVELATGPPGREIGNEKTGRRVGGLARGNRKER